MTTLIVSKDNNPISIDILRELRNKKEMVFVDVIRDITIFDRADSIMIMDNNHDWFMNQWIKYCMDIASEKKLKVFFFSDN